MTCTASSPASDGTKAAATPADHVATTPTVHGARQTAGADRIAEPFGTPSPGRRLAAFVRTMLGEGGMWLWYVDVCGETY